MDLVSLTEKIVKSIVIDADSVSVKEFPTDEDNVILKSFISILFTAFSVSIDSLTVGLGLSGITNHYIASSIIFSTCAGSLTYMPKEVTII